MIQQPPLVLVVDDERSILDSLQLIFEREGLDVQVTPDAKEALEVLRKRPVAALVTEHLANRSATHPRAANRSLDRALGPINRASHIRSMTRGRAATTGECSPQPHPLHYSHSAHNSAASFNPASMRSHARQSARLAPATRPHRTLKIQNEASLDSFVA